MASLVLAAALQSTPSEAAPVPPRMIGEAALPAWLAAKRPVLQSVELRGLAHTRESLVRRELRVREGVVPDADQVRETRLRLEETRVFESITLRGLEVAPGHGVLELELDERHGFGNLWNLLGRGAVEALRQKARLRYSNLGGRGLNLLAEYKWERTQPSLLLAAHAVRPLGLPANLEIVARRARPQYDLEDDGLDPLLLRFRSLEATARRVAGADTVLELGVRLRDRDFSRSGPDTPDGVAAGPQWGIERRLRDTSRQRAVASLRVFHALDALGSDVAYARGVLGLSYRAWWSGHGQAVLPSAEIAAQAQWGRGSSAMPLDEMFAPGAASEMEFPLRAHRQKRNGILGRGPIGRDLASGNLEGRWRFLDLDTFKAATVLFYDMAHIRRSPQGRNRTLHDFGLGLRVQGNRRSLLRIDFAHSPTDGKNALTAGIGQAF
jgi:hypothetical protein